jgi:chemotaxis protein methyltransferase CheR
MSSSSNAEFAYVRDLVKNAVAIALGPEREYLMEARLAPIAEHEGFTCVSELVRSLTGKTAGDLHWKVIEAMTTNETSFFRDIKPFEALRHKVLPQLIQNREKEKQISVWCGACSTGQEPYSLSILLREHFPILHGWKVKILATDISNDVLQKAQRGRYTQLEVNRGLPAQLLIKHFRKEGTEWQISDAIRSMVEFRRVNLIGSWPPMPNVDIVLLRNVLIYFPVETKTQILRNMRRILRPDGYLFMGTAETTVNLAVQYDSETHQTVTYYRPSPS